VAAVAARDLTHPLFDAGFDLLRPHHLDSFPDLACSEAPWESALISTQRILRPWLSRMVNVRSLIPMATFVIEDELHAEHHGEFTTFNDAVRELRRRAQIPWDREPNQAPCQSWRTCGRSYEIIEYDDIQTPWRELRRKSALEISAEGVVWHEPFGP
jgi:hypothetical protein